ncbi:MAG: BspA family leucine-rich repeat surface protein [Spirochaetales bacterium]|nr:BspA family leucine-rich repeat surface protein [Spirochaetales bacterium]
MKKYFSVVLIAVLFLTACPFLTEDSSISSDKEITVFFFRAFVNPAIDHDVDTLNYDNLITAEVPFGTDISALVATFTTTGKSVYVNSIEQISSVTANDFTDPVIYTVIAEDGSTADYTVSITFLPDTANELTGFLFGTAENPQLFTDVTADLSGNPVTATVPYGTDLSALVATFTTTGVSVKINGVEQVSGVTANDFSDDVIYTIYSESGSISLYTVSILTAPPNTANEIIEFSFLAANNPELSADITSTFSGVLVSLIVPYGTDLTGLIATFTTTGSTISVNGTPQVSDVTVNDFSNNVTYAVSNDTGGTLFYTIRVFITVTRSQLDTLIADGRNVTNLDTSGITDMSYLFAGRTTFNQDIGDWDVSSVTDMSYMFNEAAAFNQDIGSWNVGNVSNMCNMFCGAESFNKNIVGWNVGNVTNMSFMFSRAQAFNRSLGSWNTGNVTDMSYMFNEAETFNKDTVNWDVSSVANMSHMFSEATAFNQDIGSWNVGNVTDMSYMFHYAENFDQDIGDWDVSGVTDMNGMFYYARIFNQDIGDWDVGNVTDMSYMLRDMLGFEQDLSDWDVGNVTDMSHMFHNNEYFHSEIGNWDVSNVTDMSYMFHSAFTFMQDIRSWDVSKVTNMSYMFYNEEGFNWDIGGWDVGNVTDMSYMFTWAMTFNQDLGGWDVSKVTNMDSMFRGAMYFNQDISSWDVNLVANMDNMFHSAMAFSKDISSWADHVAEDISHVDFSAESCPLPAIYHPYPSWDL